MFKKWTELEAAVMYVGQQDFVQSLKQDRNVGLKRFHGTGKTIYDKLGQNSTLHKIFFDYMQAYSAYAFRHLLKKIDFKTAKKTSAARNFQSGSNSKRRIFLKMTFPTIKTVCYSFTS